MAEFKVGDNVIGVGVQYGKSIDGLRGVVKRVGGSCAAVHFENDIDGWGSEELDIPSGHGWGVDQRALRNATLNEKIIITHDGKTTLVRLYVDNNVVKRAEAKCHPDDVFDFLKEGAPRAFNRLVYGTEYHPSEVAFDGGKKAEQPSAFDWNEFKTGKIAVHCETEKKAKAFLRKCHTNGIKWASGEPTTKDCTLFHNADSCYCFNVTDGGITHGDIDFFEIDGITIMEFPFSSGEQPKQDKPETIRLLCVKDFEPGEWLTCGKEYMFSPETGITFDDGWCRGYPQEWGRWSEGNRCLSECLFPLVERRANEGESIYVERASLAGEGYRDGDVMRVIRRSEEGVNAEHTDDRENARRRDGSGWYLFDSEYSVIDGYRPEQAKPKADLDGVLREVVEGYQSAQAKPKIGKNDLDSVLWEIAAVEQEQQRKLFTGKMVCTDDGGLPFWTIGKRYEVKDGVMADDDGDKMRGIQTAKDAEAQTLGYCSFARVIEE